MLTTPPQAKEYLANPEAFAVAAPAAATEEAAPAAAKEEEKKATATAEDAAWISDGVLQISLEHAMTDSSVLVVPGETAP